MNKPMALPEQVYMEYYPKVKGYISGKVGNASDIEDLASAVFEKACKNWGMFQEQKASVSTWIYTIARNTVIDYYRTAKQSLEIPEEAPADGMVEEGLLREDMLDTLADALEKLPQRERDIILLHYYKGFTLKQIAGLMQMSYANVKLVHQKALGSLYRMMKDD